MRVFARTVLFLALAFGAWDWLSAAGQRKAPASQVSLEAPRLGVDDLIYEGAFRLPAGAIDQATFAWGGTAMAFYPEHNSLIMVGHDHHQRTAEVSIPTPGTATNLASLPRATLLQPFTDILQGKAAAERQDKIGGYLPWNGKLITSAFRGYDGDGSQATSHYVTSLNFSNLGSVVGPVAVGTWAGVVSGYMTPIPAEWQALFGGPALTGNCCLNIISRTSSGPSVSVFDPADVGAKSKVPAKMVLGYPLDHQTIGGANCEGKDFNCTASVRAVIFPPNTRSVLFLGSIGTGPMCYKDEGPPGCRGSGGWNAPPHVPRIWAYDANDLVAVKNGKKQPWDIRPYAVWTPVLRFDTSQIASAAYDPATARLYVAGNFVDGEQPLIEVYKVRLGSSSPGSPDDSRRIAVPR